MSARRIALVAPGLDVPGGQGIQAHLLAEGLRADGWDVVSVPVDPRFPPGLRWLRRLRYLRTLLNQALYLPSLARLRGVDVVHVFSASYWSFLIAPVPAMLAARAFGKRVVLHYHSGEAEDHLGRWGWLVHPWLRLAHEIAVPSEYLREIFARHGYRTRVIPNVVDTSAFRYRARRPLRPRLLSTRNFEPHYRVANTIEAFAMLRRRYPEATLTLAGAGSLEGRLRRQAAALGGGVRFAGRVERDAMPRLYDAADVFLNSSVVDNQPVSVLEAFAAGTPVVSTSTGDIAALVRPGETGVVVPPDNAEAMAGAVSCLLESPEAAVVMARRAWQEAKGHTWAAVRRAWAEVYASAPSARPARFRALSGRRLAPLLFLAAPAFASADAEVRPPVNYSILVPPPVGESYQDPVFGTSIRRISDSRNQTNNGNVGPLAFIINEYSTVSPFNADNSRILLQHQSYFALYDSEGRYLGDLPFEIAASTEPRWSRQDPNRLYYLLGNSLKAYDVAAHSASVVRTFTEYAGVSGRGEADVCFDGDHLVLVGDGHDIFVYELSTGQKGPVLDAGGHGFDSVHIAPGDAVLVSWYQGGPGPRAGVELFDRDMGFLRQLAPVGGHMDVGRDGDGEPVLLWTNAGDPQAPADCPNAVVRIRLADGARTCVLPLDWSLAVHVSAPDSGPWFIASTYAPGDPSPAAGWRRHTAEVLRVRHDGSEVVRLAHHRSRPFNAYNYTPRAAVSRDGSRLVYSSNYGLPAILGYPAYYSDVYLVDVSAAPPSPYPGSTAPVRARYEQSHPAVSYTGPWLSNVNAAHSGGAATLAMDAGARATFAFSGTAVRWIGYRDEWGGIGRVSVDGQPWSSVDTYSAPSASQASLFSTSALPPGGHTLEIEVTGTRNPSSAGTWVWVDALETAARKDEADPAVGYAGPWETETAGAHSGGSAARTQVAGARAELQFTGAAVSWIGYRDASSGIARVSIDGVPRAEIDTYAPAAAAQTIVYTLTGLPPGAHTLAIEATGRRHPLSGGEWIRVDAFETLPEEP